jgi:predicted permease
VAAAFVLVAGAGVLGRSFASLVSIDPGFPTDRLLVVDLEVPGFLYPEAEDVVGFHAALRTELAAIPGVLSVGSASDLPFAGGRSTRTGRVIGRDDIGEVSLMVHTIGGDYFQTMGVPLLSGRAFESSDRDGAPGVAIINETARRELLGEDDPLGQRISFGRDGELSVVGVVADVSPGSLTEEIRPTVYLAADQFGLHGRYQSYVLRGANMAGLFSGVRAAVAAVDPGVPLLWAEGMDRLVANSVAEPRFRTVLVAGLAGLAAILALVGIYGVVAYIVTRRTREIGIRMALGADGRTIVARVLSGVSVLVLSGLAVGMLVVALTFGHLGQFLYQVVPLDPASLGIAGLAMMLVALGASWVPARRAARLDPVRVLKEE